MIVMLECCKKINHQSISCSGFKAEVVEKHIKDNINRNR
ncbi:hypothetical protein B4U79_11485 [Dinothrombium tinctorium]|uniref:Uncharacterized protein n=1 Tax=Dinothrombium tinctorium TaxID=1965070 RepID=A0A3S3PQQ5_9ACAR|nr:hypothetical protein B4U79_06131 [Dinothrombium tinctorium]RWS14295.1 hypothetical protein B4U79_00537 [Dinothrombium tinctorium]RWS17331.1 hypothetical protein B4U79_11485 [Dinothrombium tinctorium]